MWLSVPTTSDYHHHTNCIHFQEKWWLVGSHHLPKKKKHIISFQEIVRTKIYYSNWIAISVNRSKWQFKSNKLVRKYTPFIEMKLVHGTLPPKSYMFGESRKHRGNSLIWNIGNWRHCQFCSNIFLFKVWGVYVTNYTIQVGGALSQLSCVDSSRG